jgi:hypothetical protein
MKELFGNEKFRRMVFFIMLGILLIGLITAVSRSNSETLSEYAQRNPEAAYAETDSSWKDAYTTDVSSNGQ